MTHGLLSCRQSDRAREIAEYSIFSEANLGDHSKEGRILDVVIASTNCLFRPILLIATDSIVRLLDSRKRTDPSQ